MIISPGRSYIFVHIPKTGGTSMALALEERAHRDDILIGDTPKAKKRRARAKQLPAKGRIWKHSTLSDLKGAYDASDFAEMFCFTLVRNPWDRVVSYYHWLRAQTFEHPAVTLAKVTDFPAFVTNELTAQTLASWHYARYLQDANGTEFGHFIRLEHLEPDMAPLIQHLGFRPDIPHVNRSDREGAYRSYYSDALRDRVGEICEVDIARFGYAF